MRFRNQPEMWWDRIWGPLSSPFFFLGFLFLSRFVIYLGLLTLQFSKLQRPLFFFSYWCLCYPSCYSTLAWVRCTGNILTSPLFSAQISHQSSLFSCFCVTCLVAQFCLTLCSLMDSRLLCPWDSPSRNPGVGSHSFPGVEPWSPALQADALPAEPPEKPLQCFQVAAFGITLRARFDYL